MKIPTKGTVIVKIYKIQSAGKENLPAAIVHAGLIARLHLVRSTTNNTQYIE